MPLGASRLSFLAKTQEVVAPPAQRTALSISTDGTYAQLDTAQSKFGGSSFYANNNGWIRADTPSNECDFGTGDFTVEFWYRIPNTTGDYKLCGSQGQTGGFEFRLINGVYHLGRINNTWDQTATSGATVNNWHHVAISRSGSTCRIYHNGSQVGSGTNTNNYHFGTGGIGPYFGEESVYNYATNFHIDEIRISDTARYTSGFTPSTTPFVNDSNTLLLVHADGTDGDTVFIDDNGDRAPLGVQAIADAQISTAQSKFGNSSIGMDGTGDYVKVINNGELDFGTGDFTIEWWQYLTSLDRFAIDMRGGTNGSNILIYSYPTDGSAADLYLYVNSANRISASGVLSANTWQHIALVRNSGTTRLYVNGSQAGSDYSDSTNYDNGDMLIWENGLSAGNYTPPGYVDEFRISNTARYTSGFTAPTSAFTNDSNTLLLLHAEQHDADTTVIFDDNGGTLPSGPTRTAVTSTALGNAQLDTAQYKFGTSSLLLDGTGDLVRLDNLADSIGTGDFTIEMWARPNTLPSNLSAMFTWNHEYDWNEDPDNNYIGGLVISQNTFHYGVSTNSGTYTSGMSIGTWTHVALVRNSGTIKIYYDGVEKASVSDTTNYPIGSIKPAIGIFDRYIHTSPPLGGRFLWDGWIDEFRISKIARYTSGFTPPTSAFTNDTDTLILYHFDGTDGSTTFTDDNT